MYLVRWELWEGRYICVTFISFVWRVRFETTVKAEQDLVRGERWNVWVYTWWVALLVVSVERVSQQYNHMDVCVIYKYIVKSAWKLYCLEQISYRVIRQPITFSQNITTEKKRKQQTRYGFHILLSLRKNVHNTRKNTKNKILLYGIIYTSFS
jgi:hypothetical protein